MSEKIFRVYRPLVFLCGPKFDELNPRDRRKALFDYIRDKSETLSKSINTKFSLIPVKEIVIMSIITISISIVSMN